MPARKSSRWRSFSPVEKVWVTPGPIRPPFRSLTWWMMVTARRGPAVILTRCWCRRELICAPRTAPTSGFRPRFFLATAFPLLCPGIHLTLRFGFAGLRIRSFKLYNSLLAKVVAGNDTYSTSLV